MMSTRGERILRGGACTRACRVPTLGDAWFAVRTQHAESVRHIALGHVQAKPQLSDISMMSKVKRSGGRHDSGAGLMCAQVSNAVVATLEFR